MISTLWVSITTPFPSPEIFLPTNFFIPLEKKLTIFLKIFL